MLAPANPPAIVWTSSEPVYQGVVYDYGSIDIETIHEWINRRIELSNFRTLENNWDGFEADPPNPVIVERAIAFLRVLRERNNFNPPQRVVLSSDGFVAMEWVEDNHFIQAEIADSNEVEWMVATPGQETEFWVEPFTLESEYEPTEGQTWRPPLTIAADAPAYAFGH